MSPVFSAVLSWSLALFTFSAVRSKNIHSFAGPYIGYAHKLESCPSLGYAALHIRASHFNPHKPYELQVLNGNASSKYDIADDVWSRVDMAIWNNNQWKENAFIFNFPKLACTAVREHFPNMYRLVAKYTGAPLDKKKKCVIPKGEFQIKDEPISWTFPSFKVIPYGRYRFRVQSRIDANTSYPPVFCVLADAEVIPKP